MQYISFDVVPPQERIKKKSIFSQNKAQASNNINEKWEKTKFFSLKNNKRKNEKKEKKK